MALAGCASYGDYFGVSSTSPAFYTAVNAPAGLTSFTQFHSEGPGYTTMGIVEAEGSAANILGLVSTGDTAFKTLLDKAKAGGAESIVDVYYDAKIFKIGGFYCKVDLHLYGTGVKWKK